MSKVFIEESTLVGMADLIRESKGTTDLYDPANFTDEFREIIESGSGGSSSVEEGFTVNFYDNNELIESHSVELGVGVYTPVEYGKLLWADSDGNYYTFPLTCNEPGKVYDLYLSDIPTCEEIIYGHCGVSKEEYPYLVVGLPSDMTGAYIGVYFFQAEPKLSGTTISNGGGAYLRQHIKVADDKTWTGIPYDMISITTNILSNEISLTSSASNINVQMKLDQTIEDARGTAYTNFEMQGVISEKSGRLDTTLYDSDGTLPRPYELQEKSVTSNGDITPDEGYYGLSKVTVNVETEVNLQEKTVTTNGEVIPDEGYNGLSKVVVDVEAEVIEIEPTLQEKSVTENGEVIADEGYDGLSKVIVNVDTEPNLQEKTLTENGEYTADADYDGIGKVIVNVQPNLQDKTVTENGEVVADDGYDGLNKVIVDVETGTVIEGGFTVNFYNEEGTLIESHAAELGRDIYAPASFNEVNYWSDENGAPYTLPLTINEADTVLDLYATEAQTCAAVLYSYFGIDPATHPQVGIQVYTSGNLGYVYFGSNITTSGYSTAYHKSGSSYFSGIGNNMLGYVQKMVSTPVSDFTISSNTMPSSTGSYYRYTNFELSGVHGRLDEVMYDTNDRLHPYALQDKIVTEAGVVTPDNEYYGLKSVTVDVAGGTSVENGYIANFYDENGLLIQSISSKDGLPISPPDYECVAWSKDNCGIAAVFPIMLTEDVSYYALTYGLTYADQLYAAAGLERSEYPYILYNATRNSTKQGVKHTIRFAKVHEIVGSGSDNNILYYDNIRYGDDLYHTEDYNLDFTNLEVMTRKAIEIISTLTPTYVEEASMGVSPTGSNTIYYRYVNHDYYTSTIDNLYRLDTVIEPPEAGSEINPYALQEKTVTSNGDVVPDEGYYGLSKVSVNVEGGASIEGGYTVNFYNASDELIDSHSTACGMYIDKPISYDCEAWIDADGRINEFPLTITAFGTIRDLYPSDINLCSDVVYAHCGVDKEAYPYMLIMAETTYNDIRVVFSDNINIASDGVTIKACKYVDRLTNDILSSGDLSMKNCMKALKYQAVTLKSASEWGKMTVKSTLYHYTNFDSVITTDRLDKCVY